MLMLIYNSTTALWYEWFIVGQWIKKTSEVHEIGLRIVYQDGNSIFEELLDNDNSVKIHTQNLQILGTEMFKIKNRIAPPLLKEVFHANRNYKLRNKIEFKSRNVKTFSFGTESLAFLRPKI